MSEMTDRLWNANYLKVWTGNFLLNFSFTLIVPLLPLYLSDTFGASNDAIGMALAGYTVMALIIRLFSGYVVDNYPRKVVLMVCNFFFCLLFYCHIFMDNSNPTLTSHGNRHPMFSNCIHACAHHRNIKPNLLRQIS